MKEPLKMKVVLTSVLTETDDFYVLLLWQMRAEEVKHTTSTT